MQSLEWELHCMKLSQYLVKNELSYKEFARLLGMKGDQSDYLRIYRYCNGDRRPRPAIAKKIVKLTQEQVGYADLYGGQNA